MAEECTHNCETCGANCSSREGSPVIQKLPLADISKVNHVIAVMSGKGGVGKSLVTSLLASATNKLGKRTAILDADITGPSIPKAFGVGDFGIAMHEDGVHMLPAVSEGGIRIMSSNLLLDNETDPIIWRGALIASCVGQFWTDTYWDNIDYMFVDMPPGTGDVPLTVFQQLPVDGIVVVSSPQELVSMIVEKAVKMADKMNIPILGLVENMSYVECPDCKKQIKIFGESHIDEIAKNEGLKVLAKLPINPMIASHIDNGRAEDILLDSIKDAIKEIVS